MFSARDVHAPHPMPRLTALPLLLLGLALLDCAANPPPPDPNVAQAAPRRRRRRRAAPDGGAVMPLMTAEGSMDGGTGLMGPPPVRGGSPAGGSGSFGSPIVSASNANAIDARVQGSGPSLTVDCVGNERVPAPLCIHCPPTPDSASQVRAFMELERDVLLCEPPYNAQGRLSVRVVLRSAGVATRMSFPRHDLPTEMAQCLGRTLCRLRTGNFRDPEAALEFDYVIATPSQN